MENGNAPKTANFNKSILIYLQALAFAVICWFVVPGCKDTGTENLPSTTKLDSLTLVFSNNYNGGATYWVYYRPDDTSAYKVYKLGVDQTVPFGIVKESTVTFSVVVQRPAGTSNIVYIYTYSGVPAGTWYFKSNSGYLINKLTGILKFPYGAYDHITLASPGGLNMTSFSTSARSTHSFTFNSANVVPIGNGVAYYSCVGMADSGKGFCSWIYDQPVTRDTVRMTLSSPMKKVQLTVDRPVSSLTIYGFTTSQFLSVMLNWYFASGTGKTAVPMFVPTDGLVMERYQFGMNSKDSLYNRWYYTFDTPESHTFQFPDGTINYTYNNGSNQFENISSNGEFDDIAACWTYSNTATNTQFFHVVNVPISTKTVKQPEIPASILAELGVSQNSFSPYYVLARNYDSYKDRISLYKALYQSSQPFAASYNNSYFVYKYYQTNRSEKPPLQELQFHNNN